MHLNRGALHFLVGILVAIPLVLSSQASNPQTPDAHNPDRQKSDQLKNADAAFHAGYSALQAGNLEQARIQFAQAASLAPQIPEGHEALGEVLIELGRPVEAVPELEAALQLKPSDQEIETNLAMAYEKAGDPVKAIPQFKAAFQASQQPGGHAVDADFCQAYARVLAATGKLAEAIQMFQAAAERGATTAEVFDAIGSLYAQQTDWNQAQPQFEHALSIDGSYVPARVHLGIVQRQQHDLDASLASLPNAVTLASSNALAQFEYGRTLEAASQDEAATPHLEQAVKLNPSLSGVQNELAMALQRQGRPQEAIHWFQQAIQREPGNAGALTNLGLALTLTGNAKD